MGVSVLAATGLAIIPYKRASLKKSFSEKLNTIRTQLKSSLELHFNNELQNSLRKIDDSIEPYSRFIRAEKEKIDKTENQFKELQDTLENMRNELTTLFNSRK